MKVLPKDPIKLLRIAVDDMKATLESGYKINMVVWGKNVGTPKCQVCMAGAVMLNTLKIEPNCYNDFSILYNSENSDQLSALDEIRLGRLSNFFEELEIKNYRYKGSLRIPYLIINWKEYHNCDTPQEFFDQIENLINDLKEI